jgi:hypothetical protein
MHDGSSHGARSRRRIAPNVYARRTRAGAEVFEVMFRDVDGRQRARRLDAHTERAALREARVILAGRDQGDRVVAAALTIDELAERDYFPMLESLAAARPGLRAWRRRCPRPLPAPRQAASRRAAAWRRRGPAHRRADRGDARWQPKPYAEATIDNVVVLTCRLLIGPASRYSPTRVSA